MKSTVAAFAAIAFLGLAACSGDDEFEEPLVEEGSEIEVTPAPPPVVIDTMPMDTMVMDTLGRDTL
ncbi:MAG TPA: hypothetical protein VMK65_05620 [Longimicrobiales bacterium]|nr:hypothetical protein [Longimicrobiales bacterium]